MSDLYGQTHRELQNKYGTQRLADRLEAFAHAELQPEERVFIEASSFFFLSTADERGRPTVSHKGGQPGFVRALADSTLIFPSYDGNGMFISLGNLAINPEVGLLFIDFQSPRRLRIQGRARLVDAQAHGAPYPGAREIVEVVPRQIFVNCGRYIHQVASIKLSPHVPDADGHQPFPEWKRIDAFNDALPEADRQAVAGAGGTVPLEEYRGERT